MILFALQTAVAGTPLDAASALASTVALVVSTPTCGTSGPTVDLAACPDIDGTLDVTTIGRRWVVTADVVVNEHAVVGTFTVRPMGKLGYQVLSVDAIGAPTVLAVTDLADGVENVLDDVHLQLRDREWALQLLGTARLVRGADGVGGTLAFGHEGGLSPVTWEPPLTRIAPDDGLVEFTGTVLVDLVLHVDPDDYLPDNGADDYAFVDIPMAVEVFGVSWAEFGRSCEETMLGFWTETDAPVDVTFDAGGQTVTAEIVLSASLLSNILDGAAQDLPTCR